jgi:hypothetical protein
MASNGEESEFYYGIKNNASLANTTPTLIVTKDADGTYEHATVANIPLSSAAIAALALKANLANPTFTGIINIEPNAINSKTKYIGQVIADNDYWRIYGDYAVTDNGIMAFEVGDNGQPISGTGQKFEFRYGNSADGVAKTPFAIDYDLITALANLNVTGDITALSILTNAASGIQFTSGSSWDINTNTTSWNLSETNVATALSIAKTTAAVTVASLTGTGTRNVQADANGTLTVGAAIPKVYNALLNQSALLAPVATIVSNTLDGTPAWAYVSPGQYTLTLANAFPLNKTLIFSLIGSGTAAGDTSIKCFRNSDSEIVLNTTFNAAFTNILLTNASFKIEVYP